MAFTTPKTYSSGNTLTAAELNTYQRDNISDLDDRSPSGMVPKAWGHVTNSGTPTLDEGFNISSLTDSGTGYTTINFTTAIGNATYAVALALTDTQAGETIFADTFATGSFAVRTELSNAADADRNFTFVVFADQTPT